MSQGKAYTKEEREQIIYEVMKPYFLLGQSIERASRNSKMPPTTIREWINADELLRREIEAWQDYAGSKAEELLTDTLQDKNIPIQVRSNNAQFILKTRYKSIYSERQELTGSDNKPLFMPSEILNKNGINTSTEDNSEGSTPIQSG